MRVCAAGLSQALIARIRIDLTTRAWFRCFSVPRPILLQWIRTEPTFSSARCTFVAVPQPDPRLQLAEACARADPEAVKKWLSLAAQTKLPSEALCVIDFERRVTIGNDAVAFTPLVHAIRRSALFCSSTHALGTEQLSDQVAVIRLLADAGAGVDSAGYAFTTIYEGAPGFYNSPREQLEKAARARQLQEADFSPIVHAVRLGSMAVVQLLIDLKAQPVHEVFGLYATTPQADWLYGADVSKEGFSMRDEKQPTAFVVPSQAREPLLLLSQHIKLVGVQNELQARRIDARLQWQQRVREWNPVNSPVISDPDLSAEADVRALKMRTLPSRFASVFRSTSCLLRFNLLQLACIRYDPS